MNHIFNANETCFDIKNGKLTLLCKCENEEFKLDFNEESTLLLYEWLNAYYEDNPKKEKN